MLWISEGLASIDGRCEQCQKVISVRRGETDRIEDDYFLHTPVNCSCGIIHEKITDCPPALKKAEVINEKSTTVKSLKYLIVFFLGLGLLSGTIYNFFIADEICKDPIAGVPISISPPGRIDVPFYVNEEDHFRLYLRFDKAGHSFDEIKKITGRNPSYQEKDGGIYIPVKWEVNSLQGEHIVQGQEQEKAKAINDLGFGKDYIERQINSSGMHFKPGDYRLVLYIPQDVPEFVGINTQVALRHSRSFSELHGWFTGAMYFIMCFVIASILSVILLWIYLKRV